MLYAGRTAWRTGITVLGILVATITRAEEASERKDVGGQVYTFADDLVGGASAVTVDVMGNVYVANFAESVYKIRPDGRTEVFASGLYGTTGNAVDARGNLYQASFFGDYITKIDRRGNQKIVADGLAGPMALAFGEDGDLFVSNCSSQTIAKVTPDGAVSTFAEGPLFNCPNGITRALDGNFYVVNFDDESLLKITPKGEVTHFATLPYGRNTIASARGHLYVASLHRRIYRISLMTGEVIHLAGTGERETRDGPALQASFSRPNGIAATADGGRLYVSNIISTKSVPGAPFQEPSGLRVRLITLPSLTDRLTDASHGGEELDLDALAEAYHALRKDPAAAALLDEAEMTAFAREIQRGSPETAIKVLELNAESYPDSWQVYDALAEAHAKVGHRDRAIAFYEKSLAINSKNSNATQKLEDLRDGS